MYNEKLRNILVAAVAYSITYIVPVVKLMAGVGILVIIDMVTGVLAARHRQEEISSKKLRHTVSKGTSYMLAIVASFVVQRLFLSEIETVKIVSGLIAFIELKSIDENFAKITGKSVFKSIIRAKS